MRRMLVKFGGTSLGNGGRIRLGAGAVYKEYEKGTQVAVVVSAMMETTDELIGIARMSTKGKVSARDLDDIIAMGERTSARIFAAALRSLGAEALCIDPGQEEWPVVTDSDFGSANIDLAETRRRVQRYILPLLERRVIPVICGFLGKDRQGNITTIGRGGSDTTGFLIGKCMDADEVVMVTDVDGVMSADPNKIKESRLIEKISVEEMRELARFGVQVMNPRAMDYKDPRINARVIHFRHGDLSTRGTTIIGPKRGELVGVRMHKEPLAMLTIVGEKMQRTPGVLMKAVAPLSKAGINILGVSIGPRSFSVYVVDKESHRALKLLHKTIARQRLMKSVTGERGIALLIAESERFIYTPGIIAKLTEPLARGGINIIEILSSRSSISFFVNWDDRDKALRLLRQAMKEVGS